MAYKHIEWLKLLLFFFVYLPYIIRVETVELGTSRDAFPMSANISESKAAIQSGLQTNTIHILLIMV